MVFLEMDFGLGVLLLMVRFDDLFREKKIGLAVHHSVINIAVY